MNVNSTLLKTLPILLALSSNHVYSQQVIDVESSMRNTIINQGKTQQFNEQYCKNVTGVTFVSGAAIYKKALCLSNTKNLTKSKLSNLSIISYGAVSLSSIRPSPIPESIEKELFLVKNCTPSPRIVNEDITIVTQSSFSITTNQILTWNTQTSTSGDIKLNLGAVNIGGSGSKTATFNQQISQSNSNSGSETLTKKETIHETIPAQKALLIIAEKTQSNALRDFNGSVILDGKFSDAQSVASIPYSLIINPNLPIALSGIIYGSDFKAIRKTYVEINLPTDPTACNNFDVEDYLAGGSAKGLADPPAK